MEMILLSDIDNTNKSFEDIKHIDENGVEFWYARELMPILQLVCLNILLTSISCQNVLTMQKLKSKIMN